MSSPVQARHNTEFNEATYRTNTTPETSKTVERLGRKALQNSATGMSNDLRKLTGRSTREALEALEDSNK